MNWSTSWSNGSMPSLVAQRSKIFARLASHAASGQAAAHGARRHAATARARLSLLAIGTPAAGATDAIVQTVSELAGSAHTKRRQLDRAARDVEPSKSDRQRRRRRAAAYGRKRKRCGDLVHFAADPRSVAIAVARFSAPPTVRRSPARCSVSAIQYGPSGPCVDCDYDTRRGDRAVSAAQRS
jgi:hypothetical protein